MQDGILFGLIVVLIGLSILLVRLVQVFLMPLIPARHIIGEVEILQEVPELVAKSSNSPAVALEAIEPIPYRVPNRIPRNKMWYLERRESGGDIAYSFETRESALTVLVFSILSTEGVDMAVGVAASKHATGNNLPVFQITGLPVGQEPVICDGEPIIVANDLISPALKVSD